MIRKGYKDNTLVLYLEEKCYPGRGKRLWLQDCWEAVCMCALTAAGRDEDQKGLPTNFSRKNSLRQERDLCIVPTKSGTIE